MSVGGGVVPATRRAPPGAGVDRREKPGPTIVLLDEARLVLHPCEDGISVNAVLRKFLVH